MKHFNITISGRVQGVFFRQGTKAVADQLGVRGFVQNLPDGTVYIEAEAEQFVMDSFLEWCNEGPDRAIVSAVNLTEGQVQQFKNFIVKK